VVGLETKVHELRGVRRGVVGIRADLVEELESHRFANPWVVDESVMAARKCGVTVIQTKTGDIWKMIASHLLVIPTNIGWKTKDGRNVMGRGLALQAAGKYPYFPLWYGLECMKTRGDTPVLIYPHAPLIAFPVKPLNVETPWLSWKSKATLELIERSAKQLEALKTDHPIAVSMVGCGNGGLDMADVRPILDNYLSDKRFTLVLLDDGRGK
jgi:hypothetical protein